MSAEPARPGSAPADAHPAPGAARAGLPAAAAATAAPPPGEPAPHVRIRRGLVEVDGVARTLFGGELQYFRVRDAAFDAARTHDLWAARLDDLREAGLNTISTYIPWDYHAPEDGRYDWEGARDLRRFLDLAAERGFHLIVKPGPFILAEWPYGFGSYGAIPLWWRRANRGALARDRRGRAFCWHPIAPALARFGTSLPSYASSAFRQATRGWFAAVRQQLDGLFGPGRPIVALQLDNETNLFWSDVYRIDHHPEALTRYRAHLERRYQSLARLSQVYGRRYKSFEQVQPPIRPDVGAPEAHIDWIDHQQALVADYLGALRVMWEDLGVREEDALYLTNDTAQTFPIRDLLLPHGRTKTRHGLYCLDTYPRGLPTPGQNLFDTPYESELASKLYARWNEMAPACRAGGERQQFALGIEVQGGHFPLPLPFTRGTVQPHKVSPEATRQTLLRLLAHGMRGIVLYTAVGGLNLDQSPYDFQAALGRDGERRPRYAELKRVGRLLDLHGEALRRAEPLESPLAILASGYQLGGGYGHSGDQRIFGQVLRGLFGWCAASGFTPAVTDLEVASAEELGRYRALLFPCSGTLPDDARVRLERYVEAGGTLVTLLEPGPLASTLYPAERLGSGRGIMSWAAGALGADGLFGRSARVRFQAELAAGSFELSSSALPSYRLPRDAQWVLAEQGGEGALGYRRDHGLGRAIFLSVSPGDAFTGRGLYGLEASEVQTRSLFLRRLLRHTGLRRLYGCGALEEAHALRDATTGELYLFVLSSRPEAATLHVRMRGLEGLLLERDKSYVAQDIFGEEGPPAADLGRFTGHELRDRGLHLGLPRYGATVVHLRPA